MFGLYKANKWYDNQKEPFRFLVFFIPLLILLLVSVFIDPKVTYIQLLYLFLVICIRISYLMKIYK